MGRFGSAGMFNFKMESFDRPHSPGMDEIGEILLPQALVDDILKDEKIGVQCGEAGVVGDEFKEEVDIGVMNCSMLWNVELVEVESKDGDFCPGDTRVQVSGVDTSGVGNYGVGDHLEDAGRKETVDRTSSGMNGSRPGEVSYKRGWKSLHCDFSEADLRKEKRKMANRVAAAKSHASKRAQLEMLELKVKTLRKENVLKQKSLQFLKDIPKESTGQFQLRRTSSL